MTEFDKIVHIASALTRSACETTIDLCGNEDGAKCASLTLAATALFLKSQLETNRDMFGIDYDKAKDEVINLLNDKGDEER